ncbi:S1 family peptidase [Planosporangium sp. 12N6]|uniref:S1 family peptidase n=1 Tax=Planosporangium spinosum TaxID=3402278 RepID=UPI003CF98EE6
MPVPRTLLRGTLVLSGLATAVVLATAAPASASVTPASADTGAPARPALAVAADLTATIKLNNCSATLVRFPRSVDTDRAMMLTNGHCYEGGMPAAGTVLVNRASSRTGSLLNASGRAVATVTADRLLYATMTRTDVSLYRLTQTYRSIQSATGLSAKTISASHPTSGTSMFIPSGYWKQVWQCSINGFVPTLREASWTFQDSIRYNTGCTTIHGTSGSPIVSTATGEVIGINNTVNDNGEMCTLNNPCEVDQNGNTTATKGQSYGQQTYWFTTCLTAANTVDLNVSGCLLPKPAA